MIHPITECSYYPQFFLGLWIRESLNNLDFVLVQNILDLDSAEIWSRIILVHIVEGTTWNRSFPIPLILFWTIISIDISYLVLLLIGFFFLLVILSILWWGIICYSNRILFPSHLAWRYSLAMLNEMTSCLRQVRLRVNDWQLMHCYENIVLTNCGPGLMQVIGQTIKMELKVTTN